MQDLLIIQYYSVLYQQKSYSISAPTEKHESWGEEQEPRKSSEEDKNLGQVLLRFDILVLFVKAG